MLNFYKWKNMGNNCYDLIDPDDKVLVKMFYNSSFGFWIAEFKDSYDVFQNGYFEVYANSAEEAKWKTTIEINNCCNDLISEAMKIRNNLPDFGELYTSINK